MCKCIALMDKRLAEHNTVLTKVSMLNMKTGKCRQSLVIGSERLHRQSKKLKPKVVLPTFCPFCGKRSAPKRRVAIRARAEQKRHKSMSTELSAESIQVGKVYRAKRPRKEWGEVVNDRVVLWISDRRESVQYDSQVVANGRHYPRVTMEQFLKWAKHELVEAAEARP